jgi:triosephosphate isomerase
MIYTLATASALAFSPQAGVPAGRAAVRNQLDISMMARTPLMAGNWKMNTVLDEAKSLAADVAAAAKGADGVDVAVCVPFPFLTAVGDVLKDSKVGLGAQDCYYEESGAYTAAVSTSMLKSVGTEYVLSGHSERRATFGDSDADVNKKTLKILAEGLKCILCIGELKEERESGETFNVCDTQLTEGLKGVSAEMMKDIVIAYEPVWAIGTGLTATPEVAQETHAYIRSWFVDNYSQEVADNVIIQYGGSVNDANVHDVMACADIDGALVGGASLKAESFSRIVNFNKK